MRLTSLSLATSAYACKVECDPAPSFLRWDKGAAVGRVMRMLQNHADALHAPLPIQQLHRWLGTFFLALTPRVSPQFHASFCEPHQQASLPWKLHKTLPNHQAQAPKAPFPTSTYPLQTLLFGRGVKRCRARCRMVYCDCTIAFLVIHRQCLRHRIDPCLGHCLTSPTIPRAHYRPYRLSYRVQWT